MADKKIRIGILIGSDSDLGQCYEGLEYLEGQTRLGTVEVVCCITASIHRNTLDAFKLLEQWTPRVDAWIIGAGWANHLTGVCDAYLRYKCMDVTVPVVGVSFRDYENGMHTEAAILSITEVPGTQVIFEDFVGAEGFLKACRCIVERPLPTLHLPMQRPVVIRDFKEMLEKARQQQEKEKELV